jgi:hypothetical protein
MPLVSVSLARRVAKKFCSDKSDVDVVKDKILYAAQLWEELEAEQESEISRWANQVAPTKKRKGPEPVYQDTEERTGWYKRVGKTLEPIYRKEEVSRKRGRPKDGVGSPLQVFYSFMGLAFLIAAKERPTRASGVLGKQGQFNYESKFEEFCEPICKALGHPVHGKRQVHASEWYIRKHIKAVQEIYDGDDS